MNTTQIASQRSYTESGPPRKRRRVILKDSDDDSSGDSSDCSLDEGSSNTDKSINGDRGSTPPYRSRYEAVMHEPAFTEPQKDLFVTQDEEVEQSWSSPTRIRGPRWRKHERMSAECPNEPSTSTATVSTDAEAGVINDDDFDDGVFDDIGDTTLIDLEMEINTVRSTGRTQPVQANTEARSFKQTTLFGTPMTVQESSEQTQNRAWPLTARNEQRTHHKINEQAMQKWIFPLNVGSIREYQYNIVHKALFNNVLVALPTGLGKTFIAATVMMNWYNWTKDAQIVFMAPTKPLVSQQVDACFHVAGIPRSQTTLMTGGVPSHIRAEEWQNRRVFFMTPQTLINDLKTGIADPKRLVLLVVDEAHKATGNYAYVEVVRFLRRFNESVRILALTATPGSTVESVQSVIDGLDIARVEIRTEESIDIQAFVHRRNTELEIFDNSEEIDMCLELFSKAVQPVVDKLCSQNAFWNKDPQKLTTFGLLQAQKQFNTSPAARNGNFAVKGMVNACFAVLQSLAHNLELLRFHGIGPFYHKMKHFQNAEKGGKYANLIRESEAFVTLMNRVRSWINQEDFVGHPKLEYLNSVVLNHFLDAGDGTRGAEGRPATDTRVMIFAHYRDSAEEICRVLNRHGPMIRAHVFVGQSSTKDSEGMDQKTQIGIIEKFKAGTYNTLVATMIGEEGLDIGEVDLIVCYDCSKSPIRMLQRMGRTGRKRAGKIVMLLMRDKEERDFRSAKDNYQKMQQLIERGERFNFHEDRSRRIVPREIVPFVSKEIVEIPIENTQPGTNEPSRRKAKPKKKPAKKFHMPDNVETGFQFLGTKRKSVDKHAKHQQLHRPLDDSEAPQPLDSRIFLNEQQQKDLEEHYAWHNGKEPTVVKTVQFMDYNGPLRGSLKGTGKIGHSMSSKNVVRAFETASGQRRYNNVPPKPQNERTRIERDVSDFQEAFSIQASQDEGLPDLNEVFGNVKASHTKTVTTASRSRRIIVDDEDE